MAAIDDATATVDRQRQDSSMVRSMLDGMAEHMTAQAGPVDVTPGVEGNLAAKPATPVASPYAQTSATDASATGENGRLADDQLVEVAAGQRLAKTAASSWQEMSAAAAADGVQLGLSDSYRSYDAQVAVRASRGDRVATAEPGHSVHGLGTAVDVNVGDPKVVAWLKANSARFGWQNPAWAQEPGKNLEPWHYEHTGSASNG